MLERAIAAAKRLTGRDLEQEVCRLLVEQGGMSIAWIGRLDERSRNLLPRVSAGDTTGYLAALTASAEPGPLGDGPTGRCVRTGRPAVCDDFATDPRVAPWRALALTRRIRSSAAVPIRSDGPTTRVLCAYDEEPSFFSPAVVAWLTAVADLLAIDAQGRNVAPRSNAGKPA